MDGGCVHKRALWRVSVETTAEAEEGVREILETTFGQPASVFTDAETAATQVSVFLASRPEWGPCRRKLLKRVRHLRQCGVHSGPGTVSLAHLPAQDWAESWKRHFKPLAIGRRLLVKPSWNRQSPRKGQAVIVLDPGLSFGTGHHPTTGFCLRQVVGLRRPAEPQSFLDLGTGSGILAIAAARLGYAPIAAVEFDPEALRVALANSELNRVAGSIRFLRQDITELPVRSERKFAVICANLMANLLSEHRQKLINRLQPRGVLVLAGILATEFGTVRQAYESAGLRLANSRTEGGWTSGSFGAHIEGPHPRR